MTGDAVKPYMSPNHTGGEYINFLRADYSVGKDSRPDTGIEVSTGVANPPRDNIYTSSNDATKGSASTTTMTLAAHKNADDSSTFSSK